jgi:hypothetical protein
MQRSSQLSDLCALSRDMHERVEFMFLEPETYEVLQLFRDHLTGRMSIQM